MNLVSRLLMILLTLCVALPSSADDDDDDFESCRVYSSHNFKAEFELEDDWNKGAASRLDFYIGESKGDPKLKLWSVSDLGAVFYDNSLKSNKEYDIKIEYVNTAGKSGTATYSRKSDDDWVVIDSKSLDLSTFTQDRMYIWTTETDDIDDLECKSFTAKKAAQFEFGVAQCKAGTCGFHFKNHYLNPPLVFVMPTVSKSEPDSDSPASLVITSVTSDGARIEVVTPPNFSNSQIMEEVSYFAMEPGIAIVNGKKILAGTVKTNKTSWYETKHNHKGKAHENWEKVKFKHYGLEEFSTTPVILAQLQSNNNQSKWLTAGIKSKSNPKKEVRLTLELSRSRESQGGYEREIVGFIAAEPQVSTADGMKFEFKRGVRTKSVGGSSPFKAACDYTKPIAFNAKGIVSNKQERKGAHGGWLRRCKLENSSVSFVVDEDFSDRSHTDEEVGYLAFETSDYEPDLDLVCRYFPETVQSWNVSSSKKYSDTNESKLNINQNSIRLLGWSEAYRQEFTFQPDPQNNKQSNLLRTGFDKSDTEWHIHSNPICSPSGCEVGDDDAQITRRKILEPEPVPSDFHSDTVLHITDSPNENFYKTVCSTEVDECSYREIGQTVEIQIHHDLKSLHVVSRQNKQIIVKFDTGLSIENYLASKNTNSYFPHSTTVRFGVYSANTTNLSMTFGKNVRLSIVDTFNLSNPVSYEYIDGAQDTIIYGPDAVIDFNSTNNEEFRGGILGKKVSFNNPLRVIGSVTAYELNMPSGGSIVKPDYTCPLRPIGGYTIDVSPSSSIALSCENETVKFQIKDSDLNPSGGYSGNITILASSSLTYQLIQGKGTGSGTTYQANSSGELWFDVSNRGVGDATINASIVSSATPSSVTSNTKFVANKFAISPSPLGVIAGKEQAFTIQPMECASVGGSLTPVVDASYTGDKKLTMSDFSYDLPVIPTVKAELKLKDASNKWVVVKTGTIDLKFSNNNGATAHSSVLYSEVGRVSYKLSQKECVMDDGVEKCKTYYGLQQIDARPWTFAICESNAHAMNGTATNGDAFLAAGEEFDIQLKPVIWKSGLDAELQKGKYSDFCSLDITQNFFDQNAWSSKVNLQAELPTGFVGTLHGADSDKLNTEGKLKKYISFDKVSFSDVGHLTLVASATGYDHIEVDGKKGIDTGKREIGRFYPKHIIVKSNSWDYASKHDEFAYLDQPIAIDFVAEAQNSNNEATLNYSKFASAYKATLLPFTADGDGSVDWNTRMLAPWEANTWDKAELKAKDQPFTLLRLIEKVLPKTTRLDGPFDGSNLMIGVKIKPGLVDPTEMKDNDSAAHLGDKFPTPLKARYGRVILEDLGGSIDQNLMIPLRTEFWNGSEFVTNRDDSGTEFDGAGYCSLGIWPDASSTARLSGSGEVVNGSSSKLVASQGTAKREQVRLWLRTAPQVPNGLSCSVGSKAQPWLNFNWRGKGDEIPSTVVTFGSFRGNDRVIFRGESRFTGQ